MHLCNEIIMEKESTLKVIKLLIQKSSTRENYFIIVGTENCATFPTASQTDNSFHTPPSSGRAQLFTLSPTHSLARSLPCLMLQIVPDYGTYAVNYELQ